MINAKDIRAITEAARNKVIIKDIEETIKHSAHQGYSYCTLQVESPKSELDIVAEYFRSAGFYFDTRSYNINRVTGVTIYNITVRW